MAANHVLICLNINKMWNSKQLVYNLLGFGNFARGNSFLKGGLFKAAACIFAVLRFLKELFFLLAFALALAGKLAEKLDKPHEIILKRKT